MPGAPGRQARAAQLAPPGLGRPEARALVPVEPPPDDGTPAWVPAAARDYLAHVEGGRSLRDLARESQVHPSTILRRVRRVESARDDPLVDGALRDLTDESDPQRLNRDALPILRRLVEARTILAVAQNLDVALVLREGGDGEPQRLLAVERRLAEAMALRDWIACGDPEGRVCRYKITGRGRLVLKRLAAEARKGAGTGAGTGTGMGTAVGMAAATALVPGLAEAPAAFDDDPRLRHMRSLLAESPLAALARRRDHDGRLWLERDLVGVGERLREDFELGQKGGARDWEAWLEDPARTQDWGRVVGPAAARARVERAMLALGPGLADVCLRCCCLLEGLEGVERRLGWSARSGKVVLRIALEQLRRHYGERDGEAGLIG